MEGNLYHNSWLNIQMAIDTNCLFSRIVAQIAEQ